MNMKLKIVNDHELTIADAETGKAVAYVERGYADVARLLVAAPELLQALDELNVHLTTLNAAGRLPNDKKLNRLIRETFDTTEQIMQTVRK